MMLLLLSLELLATDGPLVDNEGQCSQSSGAPVGPGGGTAKSPGWDGTAKRSPSSSFIPTCRAT